MTNSESKKENCSRSVKYHICPLPNQSVFLLRMWNIHECPWELWISTCIFMLHFLLYVGICDKISAIKFVYWQASFVASSPVTNIAGSLITTLQVEKCWNICALRLLWNLTTGHEAKSPHGLLYWHKNQYSIYMVKECLSIKEFIQQIISTDANSDTHSLSRCRRLHLLIQESNLQEKCMPLGCTTVSKCSLWLKNSFWIKIITKYKILKLNNITCLDIILPL